MSSKWFLSLRFPRQHPVCISPLHRTCHMPYCTHSSLLDYLNNILSGVKIIKFLIMRFPLITFYLFPLRPKYLSQHPSPEHPLPMFFPQRERRLNKANINRRMLELQNQRTTFPQRVCISHSARSSRPVNIKLKTYLCDKTDGFCNSNISTQ
jgi:hypothetical protein